MFNRLFRGHVYVNMVKVSYSPEQNQGDSKPHCIPSRTLAYTKPSTGDVGMRVNCHGDAPLGRLYINLLIHERYEDKRPFGLFRRVSSF